MKKVSLFMLVLLLAVMVSCSPTPRELRVFSGSVVKPVLDAANVKFTKDEGIEIIPFYSGSGIALTQAILSNKGDIYISASKNYIDKAIKKDFVEKSSVKTIARIVPAIVVKKGNPKGIHEIRDLLRGDVSFAIAAPGSVVIGDAAKKLFLKTGDADKYLEKVRTTAASASQLFSFLTTGSVDVIIGWQIMKGWAPDKVDVINLPNDLTSGLESSIAAGIVRETKHRSEAGKYLEFLTGNYCQQIFKNYGYGVK